MATLNPKLKEPLETGHLPIETEGPKHLVDKVETDFDVRAGVSGIQEQIVERVEAIEKGIAPAVDPVILKQAKEAIAHESGGVAEPRAELQRFLDMLNGGEIVEPARDLDIILDAAANNHQGNIPNA